MLEFYHMLNFNAAAKMLYEKGFYVTDIPMLDVSSIQNAFTSFIAKDESYKRTFLQEKINVVFDGYSYIGQQDSLNQSADDLVSTFVLSEFVKPNQIPHPFLNFYNDEFADQSKVFNQWNIELAKALNISMTNCKIGQMISANHYPNFNQSTTEVALSAHPDVSLFTIFPFGIDECLEIEINGKWQFMKPTKTMVVMIGYLSEYLTHGKLKALNHRVSNKRATKSDRYSFAYFGLMAPDQRIKIGSNVVTSEKFYNAYLSLF